MFQRIRNISFLIVGFIILVHNITPHLHHDELSNEHHLKAHCEANNIFDWVLLSFHNNLGSGHLECFSEIENIDVTPHLGFIIPEDLILDIYHIIDIRQENSEKTSSNIYFYLPDIFRNYYHSLTIANRPPPSFFFV